MRDVDRPFFEKVVMVCVVVVVVLSILGVLQKWIDKSSMEWSREFDKALDNHFRQDLQEGVEVIRNSPILKEKQPTK